MDSPTANLFFKRFYTYCTLSRRSVHSQKFVPSPSLNSAQFSRDAGTYSHLRKDAEHKRQKQEERNKKEEVKEKLELPKGYITRKDVDKMSWQKRKDEIPASIAAELHEYEVVTADQQRQKTRRPKRVKMPMRDFIEGT